MERMEWNEGLSVGIELVDQQHKRWIGHLNDISAAIESRQGASQIAKTLDFLVDFYEFSLFLCELQLHSLFYLFAQF